MLTFQLVVKLSCPDINIRVDVGHPVLHCHPWRNWTWRRWRKWVMVTRWWLNHVSKLLFFQVCHCSNTSDEIVPYRSLVLFTIFHLKSHLKRVLASHPRYSATEPYSPNFPISMLRLSKEKKALLVPSVKVMVT